MNIKIVEDQNLWDNFVLAHAPLSGGFLHSWAWGEALESRGRKIHRLGFYQEESPTPSSSPSGRGRDLAGVALLIENPASFKKYFYIPRGPITVGSRTPYSQILAAIADFAKKEGAMFLRFEPAELAKDFKILTDKIPLPFGPEGLRASNGNPPLQKGEDFKPSPFTKGRAGEGFFVAHHLQPENTLLLDLEKSEDELRAAMHEKTRYNIGLAERKGVIVKEFNDNDILSPKGAETAPLQIFMRLLDETVRRDKIKMYSRNYFESILKSTDDNFGAKIWIAYYYPPMPACFPSERGMEGCGGVGVPIAAAFNIYFGKIATYLFGASSDKYRNLMAPHLLQWETIRDAKTRGFKYYDFWGINPKDIASPNYYPRWEGFSRFKRGFVEKSGTSLELLYAPCLELPISQFWYKLFKLVKKVI